MNMKKVLIAVISIFVLMIAIVGITFKVNNNPTSILKDGIAYMDAKEFDKAKENFQKIINDKVEGQKATNLIEIIDTYLSAKNLFDEGKLKEALSEIESINLNYKEYSISEDIEAIKDKINYSLKQVEIENNIAKVISLIDNKEYESAKEEINNLKNEDLSETQKNTLIDIENRIVNEEAKIAQEEAEKKAEEEKLNIPTNKISQTSVASYSEQIIGVVSDGGSFATLVRWEKNSDGTWQEIDSMPARLGKNGMAPPSFIYEMDKRTPTGVYSLTEAFGINSNPGSGLPYRVVDDNDYWVDDPDSQYYNQWMEGPANGRWNSAEHLASFPGHYNYSVVIDYNRWPVIPGKSSAIFLHCEMGVPTYGCIAVSESKMIEILKWLNPNKKPQIIIAESWNELYSY